MVRIKTVIHSHTSSYDHSWDSGITSSRRRLLVKRPWVMNLNSSTYCSSLNRTRSSSLKMLHRSILNKASYLILSSIYYWACTHLSAYNLCFKTFLFLTGPFLDKNKLMLLPDFAHLFLLWSYAFCRNTPNIVLDPPRLALALLVAE